MSGEPMGEHGSKAMTIETLEKMFVYLGCANIPTQQAMDGAVPIESMLGGDSNGVISELQLTSFDQMGSSWALKSVWFNSSEESLSLATVSNLHWSVLAVASNQRYRFPDEPPYPYSESDAWVRLHFSVVDKHGRFKKFPIRKRWENGLIYKELFNPHWTFEFKDDSMRCWDSSSAQLKKDLKVGFLVPFLCGVHQSLDNYWLVKTRFDDLCPSLTLLTDPTGVKEFWRLRDIPPGKKRRAALLHWVSDHWRQTRIDPDVETYVRKHMRGTTDINQGSFRASIMPSKKDKLTNDIARRDREKLRLKKQDRRKRNKQLARKRKAGRT